MPFAMVRDPIAIEADGQDGQMRMTLDSYRPTFRKITPGRHLLALMHLKCYLMRWAECQSLRPAKGSVMGKTLANCARLNIARPRDENAYRHFVREGPNCLRVARAIPCFQRHHGQNDPNSAPLRYDPSSQDFPGNRAAPVVGPVCRLRRDSHASCHPVQRTSGRGTDSRA